MVKILPTVGDAVAVEGSKWTVNDSGELHVYNSERDKAQPVASFARGTWLSVQVTN